MNSASTMYAADPTPDGRPAVTTYDAPTLGLRDLLAIVASTASDMDRDAMTLVGFYNRAASVLAEFTEDQKTAYLALLDPTSNVQPTDVLPRGEIVPANPGAFGPLKATVTP